jgi:hypothetical protein
MAFHAIPCANNAVAALAARITHCAALARAFAMASAKVPSISHAAWKLLQAGHPVQLGVAPAAFVDRLERSLKAPPQARMPTLSGVRKAVAWSRGRWLHALAAPWTAAARRLGGLAFWHASLITALPATTAPANDRSHQGWHTDWTAPVHGGPRGAPKLSIIVYLCRVSKRNGATQFRDGRKTWAVEGPRGTVVAFFSHRVTHRGMLNRSSKPRKAAMFVFACRTEPLPFGLARRGARTAQPSDPPARVGSKRPAAPLVCGSGRATKRARRA